MLRVAQLVEARQHRANSRRAVSRWRSRRSVCALAAWSRSAALVRKIKRLEALQMMGVSPQRGAEQRRALLLWAFGRRRGAVRVRWNDSIKPETFSCGTFLMWPVRRNGIKPETFSCGTFLMCSVRRNGRDLHLISFPNSVLHGLGEG